MYRYRLLGPGGFFALKRSLAKTVAPTWYWNLKPGAVDVNSLHPVQGMSSPRSSQKMSTTTPSDKYHSSSTPPKSVRSKNQPELLGPPFLAHYPYPPGSQKPTSARKCSDPAPNTSPPATPTLHITTIPPIMTPRISALAIELSILLHLPTIYPAYLTR